MQKLNHTTFYIKYKIFGYLSLRYHYLFQDNKKLENKWILKDHNSKKYSVLTEEMAEAIFENFKIVHNCEPEKEIIAGFEDPEINLYKKINLKNNSTIEEIFNEFEMDKNGKNN